MNMYKSYLILGFVLVALLTSGCVQQENERNEEVRELVTSFLGACNNDSARKMYSMFSDDLKTNYSVNYQDVRSLTELTGHDFNLNPVEFSRQGDKVMVNTTVSIDTHEGSEVDAGWATIAFHITYNDSEAKIGNTEVLERIGDIYRFSWDVMHRQEAPTLLPVSYAYYKFIGFYNHRNATEIYTLFSEGLKEEQSLDEVRGEVDFARNHDIELLFNYSEISELGSGYVEQGTTTMEMPAIMKTDEGRLNCSIKCVYIVKYEKEELNNSSLFKIVSGSIKIDNWVFDELEECYNNSKRLEA